MEIKLTESDLELFTITKDVFQSRDEVLQRLAKQDLPLDPELGVPVEVYQVLSLYAEAIRSLSILWAMKFAEILEES